MDHKLEKFLAIVEAGSFTQAAAKIHISQPALSVTITDLEAELGVVLLYRGRGHFGLTDAGQIVYDTARRIRSELQAMRQLLAEHSSNKMILRVGLLDTVANLLLASDTMSDNLSGLEVKVDNSTRLISEVRFGRLDIAIIAAQTSPVPAGVRSTPIGEEVFSFVGKAEVVTTTNPKYVSQWLAFNQASNTYAHFVKEFARYGIMTVPSFYSTSMDLLRSMALSGKGIALLPLHFCAAELGAGNLISMETPPLSRPLWLVQPDGQVQSPRAKELVARLARLLQVKGRTYESSVEPPNLTTAASTIAIMKKLAQ